MNDLKKKILQGTSKSLETIGINKLKRIIHNSEEEKCEQGLLFCGSTDIPPFGNISRSYLCVGDHCNVVIKDCEGKKQIGSFHTHPHSETSGDIGNLSGKDIYESVSHKHSFSCIGLIEKVTKESTDELTKAYDEQIKADDELYQASRYLAKKLLSKEADLIIK